MNIDEVRELILLFDETNLTEMEIQNQDFKLNLRKSSGARNSNQGSPLAADWSAGLEEESLPQDTPELHEDAMAVVSPMVGTFYRAPAPDAPPFVEVGDRVEAGQTLCIVEAMKLMNEIKSDIKGIIVEIMVENAQPVEYGQTMFLIAKE